MIKMKKYFIVALTFIISIVFHIVLRGVSLNKAFGGILFQLLGSAILGYVVSMFVAKYKKNDWVKYWQFFYVFMVIGSLISYWLDIA